MGAEQHKDVQPSPPPRADDCTSGPGDYIKDEQLAARRKTIPLMDFNARRKWGAVASTISAASAFNKGNNHDKIIQNSLHEVDSFQTPKPPQSPHSDHPPTSPYFSTPTQLPHSPHQHDYPPPVRSPSKPTPILTSQSPYPRLKSQVSEPSHPHYSSQTPSRPNPSRTASPRDEFRPTEPSVNSVGSVKRTLSLFDRQLSV